MSKCRLFIIRHTQTLGNVEKRLTGRQDYEITEKGKRYIKLLTEKYKNIKFDAAYSSTSERAIKTIEPLAQLNNIQIIQDENLCEMYFGIYDGWKWEDLNKIHPEIKQNQINTNEISGIPGQESMTEVAKRMYKCITKIAKNNLGKTVLISSHGISIEEFLRKIANKKPNQDRKKFSQLNTAVNELLYENGKFEILKIGYMDHLRGGNKKK